MDDSTTSRLRRRSLMARAALVPRLWWLHYRILRGHPITALRLALVLVL